MKTVCIIGAGVVGCAIAKDLSNENVEVHIIEKNHSFGEGVTSRNSGVIHAGFYYLPGSLKSTLCQEGRALLYQWCAQKSVPHKKTGKLIVVTKAEDEISLENLYRNALKSGIKEMQLSHLSKYEIQAMSPYVKGVSALYSSESGIVDVHAFCQGLYVEAMKKSAQFHFNCEVQGITHKEGYVLHTTRGDISCDMVINAAGLYADEIAKMAGIHKYTIYPWRGDYFKISLPYKIDHLVYPVHNPNASGLGIHLTMNMQGNYFLGPDCEPSDSKENFGSKSEKLMQFYESASQLLDGLQPNVLSYETCGIRPKLRAFDEKEEKDFIISEDLSGFINLVGIESPGLTASLAIAKYVSSRISL